MILQPREILLSFPSANPLNTSRKIYNCPTLKTQTILQTWNFTATGSSTYTEKVYPYPCAKCTGTKRSLTRKGYLMCKHERPGSAYTSVFLVCTYPFHENSEKVKTQVSAQSAKMQSDMSAYAHGLRSISCDTLSSS